MRKSICLFVAVGFILGVAAQQPQQQPPVPVVQPNFRQQIANTPNANKADRLAWGILTVQNEVVDLSQKATQADAFTRQQTNQLIAPLQQSATNHEQQLSTLKKDIITPIAQHIKAIEEEKLGDQIAALQKQLNEFRTAACPALKSAKLKDTEKTNLEKICQSDSAPAK